MAKTREGTEATDVPNQEEQAGLLSKMKGIFHRPGPGWTEIDGETMTTAAAALIMDKGAVFVGNEFVVLVDETAGRNLVNTIEYDPRRHDAKALATKRRRLYEYLYVREGADKGRLGENEKGYPEAWMVISGGEPRHIGQRFGRPMLERLREKGVLGKGGEELLQQMTGTPAEPVAVVG